MTTETVGNTPEYRRVRDLPRRDDPADLARDLTALLRRPGGSQTLRDAQALALHDIGLHGGAFLPMPPGDGKTLVSLLAAYVTDAKRPLLLLPANLIGKTAKERDEVYAQHWPVSVQTKLMSYEILGRVQAAEELEAYAPDLIIMDEVHKLKNPKAAVTRRVLRYMADHPDTRVIAMSGTIMRDSLLDFAHVAAWALRDRYPLPASQAELQEWAHALDEGTEEWLRVDPGPLADDLAPAFGIPWQADRLQRARLAFQARLNATPGVVSTVGRRVDVGAALRVRPLEYEVSPTTREHVQRLRRELLTPDDWDCTPVDVWRHMRELALGFHGVWDPRPPKPWRDARRGWFSFVRGVLESYDRWDSPDHVAQAVDAGLLNGDKLNAWRAIAPTFIPNPVPVWHDESALVVAKMWMAEGPGIVWVAHVPFAERLAAETGAPYYAQDGLSADGTRAEIEKESGTRPIIASIAANSTGRNLQMFSRNLLTASPSGADALEQLIARTHRPGQRASVVTVDVFLACLEHGRAFGAALAAARAIRDTTGSPNKLLEADVYWPSAEDLHARGGPMWGGTARPRAIPPDV